jgi:hypothetical protein
MVKSTETICHLCYVYLEDHAAIGVLLAPITTPDNTQCFMSKSSVELKPR